MTDELQEENTETPACPDDLQIWLLEQPKWQQHAAQLLVDGVDINDNKIEELADMAIDEATGKGPASVPAIRHNAFCSLSHVNINIKSISNISSINQLNPRKPLDFGDRNIVVVYGSNGSGKSGYVRILKHSCGARDTGKLHPNVYDSSTTSQACDLDFSKDGDPVNLRWEADNGPVPELMTVDIFDASSGHSYLAGESEVSYEPQVLDFLSALVSVVDRVAKELDSRTTALLSKLPSLPSDLSDTKLGKWYTTLKFNTPQAEIDTNCSWTPDLETKFSERTTYLAEKAPKERAKELLSKKQYVDGLINDLKKHHTFFDDAACKRIMDYRKTVIDKQQVAEAAAKQSIKDTPLEGVGSDVWMQLWAIAREYSKKHAYPEIKYPYTEDDARCVLCQQELSPNAKSRIKSFDEYVNNVAAEDVRKVKDTLNAALESLPDLPSDDELQAKLDAAGLSADLAEKLLKIYESLHARSKILVTDTVVTEYGPLAETSSWISEATSISESYDKQSTEFSKESDEEARKKKKAEHAELTAKKWLSEQKAAVEAEVERKLGISILQSARSLASSRSLSLKKRQMAESLITDIYVTAFNTELKNLGASSIKVTLDRTRVDHGAVLHEIKLKDTALDKDIHEILSEGEHRIVSLAAFLADVTVKPNNSTFVFDDPISSLDLDYEEAVVCRLVNLAKERQVIIFTHRLSLLGMVEDYSKKAGITTKIVHLTKEPWGAGEPGDQTIESAKPKAVLNHHLPEKLREAKSVYDTQGTTAYKPFAQSICTETRKLIERLVEYELLADVVQRHRRAVNTLGKIDKLPIIIQEDCMLIDEMMTKYSRYEHAQSLEAPVELPVPDEIAEDIQKLRDWRDSFDQRRQSM